MSSFISSVAVILVVYSTATFSAQSLPTRQTIRGHSLALNGQAVRSELFGMIELYRIGLYLLEQTSDTSRIAPDVPKALQLQVLHDTRSRYLPEAWRDELLAVLAPEETQKLRAAYAKVQAGDTITISYVPGEGSRLAINDNVVLQSDSRELMNAFLDQWLGQDPISEEIKAALLGRAN